MWNFLHDDSFSSPDPACFDDADWEVRSPDSLQAPLSAEACSDAYFRNRELLGLLTPAH